MLISRTPDASPLAAIARVLTVAVALALVLLAVWVLARYLFLIFLCILIATMLHGLAELLHRYGKVPMGIALALVALGLTAAVIMFLWYIGPHLVDQASNLYAQVTGTARHLRVEYANTPIGRMINQFGPQSDTQKLASSAATIATSTLGGVVTLFVVIVTSLYFAISPRLYLDGAVTLLPRGYRARAREILGDSGRTLQFWLLGQAIDMAAVGLLVYAGLMLLGVKLAMALAVLAGVLTFVPYFGAIAAAVPAILVAAATSWELALYVAGLFILAHSLEGYVISPLVQRRTVHMPPAVTILSMTILGGLGGAIGVVLAAPIAAVGLVLVREAYVEDVLHERAGRTPVEASTRGT